MSVQRPLPADPPPYAREPLLADARWDLVQRVAASAAFQKSRRLRDFLVFVCERALRDPSTVVREQEIGTAVFGRPSDFDPSHDTLVRVHASQLRKRLQQHFSSEGAGETVVIEIPKGTYMPAFREREVEAPAAEPARPAERPPWIPHRTRVLVAGGIAAVLAATSTWLLVENHRLQQRLAAGLDPQPGVERLWRQLFGNGRHTYVVLADSNLTMYQDLIHDQLTATQYQRQNFKGLAGERLKDPVSADFAVRLMNRAFTSMSDVGVARRISLLHAALGVPTDIILARDAGPRHFKSHNVILSGPRRANPWLELFEGKLTFRSRFDENPRLAYFENLSPRPGEAPRYDVTWDRLGYCRVAHLPNLDGTGSVLILSGTDMASSEAGVEFITSESGVKQLRSVLGLNAREPVPHFEMLLRTQLVVGAAPNFELIAHRRLEAGR